MARVIDLHPLELQVGDFVAGLQELEREPITTARVHRYLSEAPLRTEVLKPYLFWNTDVYTRNLIYRDQYFEVMALCWLSGQRTPVHSHNGQLGWVTVVQGEMVCREYKFVRADRDGPAAGAIGGRHVEVELLGSANCQADGSVATVDRRHTTHQIENLETSRWGSVSLHIYSKPIDSCAVFEASSRCCQRRVLQYYSVGGVVLSAEASRTDSIMEHAGEVIASAPAASAVLGAQPTDVNGTA